MPVAGSFCQNRTFALSFVNDLIWVGSRHGADRATKGGFALILKNSCRAAIDPGPVIAH
jgi:hypothetical protein